MKIEGNSVLTISVSEDFNMNFFSEFRNAYCDTSGKYNKYIIDLLQTKNMSTCALGMLLQMHDYLGCDNVEIHIINCNRKVIQLLEIASIDHLFHISSK
jgi:HptB-dependent secretion and biofilm anti anti-sigma factor